MTFVWDFEYLHIGKSNERYLFGISSLPISPFICRFGHIQPNFFHFLSSDWSSNNLVGQFIMGLKLPDEVYSRLEYAHWDLHTRTCTLRSHAHQPPLAPNAWNITKHYLKRHNQCISECQHSIGKWQCYDDSLFEHIHIPMIYDEC